MRALILSAAAATLVATAPAALAQDEEAIEPGYSIIEEGGASHDVTGVVCPDALGEQRFEQVLSFDQGEEHLGIACMYQASNGESTTFSVTLESAEALVGAGSFSERWNVIVLNALGQYRGVLPAPMGELGPDEDAGMRAAVFEITQVAPRTYIRIGVWMAQSGPWIVYAKSTYLTTEDGEASAAAVRQAVLDAVETIDG